MLVAFVDGLGLQGLVYPELLTTSRIEVLLDAQLQALGADRRYLVPLDPDPEAGTRAQRERTVRSGRLVPHAGAGRAVRCPGGGRRAGRGRRPRCVAWASPMMAKSWKSAAAWAMNCWRSAPATGGSGRRFTAAARSRKRVSISSTSNAAMAATVPGGAQVDSGAGTRSSMSSSTSIVASTLGVRGPATRRSASRSSGSTDRRRLRSGGDDLGLGDLRLGDVGLGVGLDDRRRPRPRRPRARRPGAPARRARPPGRRWASATGVVVERDHRRRGQRAAGRAPSSVATGARASARAKRRSPITSSGPGPARRGAVERTSQTVVPIITSPIDDEQHDEHGRRRGGRCDHRDITDGGGEQQPRPADHRRFTAGATDTRRSSARPRRRAAARRRRAGSARRAPAPPATASRCGCRRGAASPAAGGGWRAAARPPRRAQRGRRPVGIERRPPQHLVDEHVAEAGDRPSGRAARPSAAPAAGPARRRDRPGAASARRDRAARRPAPATPVPAAGGRAAAAGDPSSSRTDPAVPHGVVGAGAVGQPLDRPAVAVAQQPAGHAEVDPRASGRRCGRRAASRGG